jgi:hypothetical protein
LKARTTGAAAIAAFALLTAGCGDSEPELKVGACTNADPTEALSFDVKAVECDAKEARSRVVREVDKADRCDVASVTDSQNDKVFCTEPYPLGSVPVKPAVGVCTTADPRQTVTINIRLVKCDDPQAKSRITKRVESESECDKPIRGKDNEVFCIEPI